MTEHQRSIYEIAIQSEWMSENAFIMAWNDFKCLIKGTSFDGNNGNYFINWLLN